MTHHMNLKPQPFAMVASGMKTIELRLYDKKRQTIQIGDQILFTNTENAAQEILVTVKNLHHFPSFEVLYKTLPLEKCGYLSHELATASPSDMEQYYSAEEQSKNGVLGIEIELANNNHPKHILFDLDGTLTDSGVGIIKCAKLTLAHYGLPTPDDQTMRTFVGPPLMQSFRKYGVSEEKIAEAVFIYRSRYTAIGMFENFPYPGISELLQQLNAQGHRLYVATSKPEHMAITILEHFGLAQYFDRICGAASDDTRSKKEEVIAYLLKQTGRTEDMVMVGDTIFDIVGAKANGMEAIGVAWGYGNVEEMKKAGARIAETPEELLLLINTEKAC